MKSLILAGGRGKRIKSFSNGINKCMLEFNRKPIIENSLQASLEAEVKEIVIVVGYQAEKIINRYGINYKGIKINYVIQQEQKGLVHAIEVARHVLNKSDFFLMLGDEILLEPKHGEMIKQFERGRLFVLCGVVKQKERSKISKTYSIIQDHDRNIFRLIEKPKNPMNEWQGTGNCLFRNEIYNFISQTPINQTRGEKELPDLIQCAIDDGKKVKSFEICRWYTNINSEEDLKEANKFFQRNKKKPYENLLFPR